MGGAIVGIGAYALATVRTLHISDLNELFYVCDRFVNLTFGAESQGRVEEIAQIPRGITIGAIALGWYD